MYDMEEYHDVIDLFQLYILKHVNRFTFPIEHLCPHTFLINGGFKISMIKLDSYMEKVRQHVW